MRHFLKNLEPPFRIIVQEARPIKQHGCYDIFRPQYLDFLAV